MLKRWLTRLLVTSVILAAFAIGSGVAAMEIMAKNLAPLDSMSSYDPPTTSRVFDTEGRLIARFATQRRTVIDVDTLPPHVKRAFLAAEDASFYEHQGVDLLALTRAVYREACYRAGLGCKRSGGSTITQQTAKTFFLSPERTLTRKLKELLLTRRIESNFTKDQILGLYLNQIYFGHGAYGIEEAAKTYYGRSAKDLSVSQAAVLASVPKSPARINPFTNPARVRSRRAYVLGQMEKNGWISPAQRKKALTEKIRAVVPRSPYMNAAPYLAEAIRIELTRRFGKAEVAHGGYTVYAPVDAKLQVAANAAMDEGLRAVDKRQGWRGPRIRLDPDVRARFSKELRAELDRRVPPEEAPELKAVHKPTGWPVWDLGGIGTVAAGKDPAKAAHAMRTRPLKTGLEVAAQVRRVDDAGGRVVVDLGTMLGVVPFSSMKWARKASTTKRTAAPKRASDVVRRGDVVWVKVGAVHAGQKGKPRLSNGKKHPRVLGSPWAELTLEQKPKVQGALVAMDPFTHRVVAMVGGADFARSKFNRATQARRQPGSALKPFIYGLAVDQKRATAATIVSDVPKVFVDRWTGKKWKPKNAGNTFRGDISLRTCLTHSINTCSVTLVDKLGIDAVHQFGRELGLNTPERPFPKSLTIALGTPDVVPLALVNAYTIFPGGGKLAEPILFDKIKDRRGTVVYQSDHQTKQVMSEEAAYIMSNLMQSVVQDGTARRAKALGRPVAGKTGTTNNNTNAWFVGFSPELVAGVYVGFDEPRGLGRGEYGGKAALPIWLSFMKKALDGVPVRDFKRPDTVIERPIDERTGLLVTAIGEEKPAADAAPAAAPAAPEKKGFDILGMLLGKKPKVPTAEDLAKATAETKKPTAEAKPVPQPQDGTTDPTPKPPLPKGARWEVFMTGTEPTRHLETEPPPPLELFESGGLGP